MKDDQKTKKQLIEELNELRKRVAELKDFEEEIKETRVNHEKFTKAFLQSSVPVGITTLKEGRFVEVSDAFLRFMGRKRNEVVGNTATGIGFITEEQRRAFFKELNKKGRVENLEMKVRSKDGALIEGLFNAVMMNLKYEKYLLTVMTDITERKRWEDELRASEERYRFLVRNTSDYVARYSLTGELLFASEAMRFMLGYNPEEIIGNSGLNRVHPDDRPIVHETLKKASEMALGKDAKVEYRAICQDGSYKWVELSGKKVWNGAADRMEIIATVRDITDRKQLEEELREASLHDLLTGIHNRRGFFALAEQQVKAATRSKMHLVLTYLDCDDFKWINDCLGHEQGDKVLVDTAHILRQTFRESDIIARIGGDEFVVLSIEAADVDPAVFLKRLQQNINEYNAKETRRYKLSLSWGTVAYAPESPESLDVLLSQADRLMYMHKNAKSNNQS